MADAYIGLDLGTTGIKAVAFDDADGQLAAAVVPTPVHRRADGGADFDGDELWRAATAVLREVTGRLAADGHRPVATATASMGESGVLLGPDGRPVAPIIAWFDERTEPEAEWWAETVGRDRTCSIAGVPPRAVFGGSKMVWTRRYDPDAWSAGRHWLNMADWAAYRLTGEMATDHSLASRTMLFDLADRCWSDELVEAAGLDRSMLAPLVESGRPVGRVTAEASAETGLPVGTVVGAGGQDHVCAALALGVTEPGMLLDSIGTSEAFFLVTDGFDRSGRLSDVGIGQGAHVEPGRTYAMTGLHRGGVRVDDARRASGLDWDDFLATAEADRIMNDLAAEGQEKISLLITATRLDGVDHLVTGGGSRNAELIDRKRRIGGRPIEVTALTETTALGAARLAARALRAEDGRSG